MHFWNCYCSLEESICSAPCLLTFIVPAHDPKNFCGHISYPVFHAFRTWWIETIAQVRSALFNIRRKDQVMSSSFNCTIIWLASRESKMNRIPCSVCLPTQISTLCLTCSFLIIRFWHFSYNETFILHLPISLNTPCFTWKFCITFVFSFFWVTQFSYEKQRTILM